MARLPARTGAMMLGMTIEIRTPDESQWEELFLADARGFGYTPEPGDIDLRRPIIDLARFRVAVDAGRIVGVAGSWAMDVTIPGGTTVPMTALTWVSVAATHRRQGVLTGLMDACHRDGDERGEPVAMLYASEGGIYERFGYGVATTMRRVVIERHDVSFRPDVIAARGAVSYIDGDDAVDHIKRLWERTRRQRAGEVSRSAQLHQFIADIWAKPQGTMTAAFTLAHVDGYAAYRIGDDWSSGSPRHRLELLELVAASPQAHIDLWHTVIGIDLVGTISTRMLAIDDPLPLLLTNRRAVSTTMMQDGVWANVRDIPVCFGARAYGTADRLVIEVADRRYAIESDGTESACKVVRSRPDLVVDQPSLGALMFGGVPVRMLVGAGRISARNEEALRRADAFFVTGPAPFSQTFF